VPDPKGLLRPDTYLNVRILNSLGQKLAVPDDAVLFTNAQTYVFVKDEEGRFHPRTVQLGAKVKNFYEVKDGLKEGEMVVTGANFLLDSESRLKAAILEKEQESGEPASQSKPDHAHGDHP
jgi:membrane fusion protein, copper/silver efflux system